MRPLKRLLMNPIKVNDSPIYSPVSNLGLFNFKGRLNRAASWRNLCCYRGCHCSSEKIGYQGRFNRSCNLRRLSNIRIPTWS